MMCDIKDCVVKFVFVELMRGSLQQGAFMVLRLLSRIVKVHIWNRKETHKGTSR